jgi:hypothetical protein
VRGDRDDENLPDLADLGISLELVLLLSLFDNEPSVERFYKRTSPRRTPSAVNERSVTCDIDLRLTLDLASTVGINTPDLSLNVIVLGTLFVLYPDQPTRQGPGGGRVDLRETVRGALNRGRGRVVGDRDGRHGEVRLSLWLESCRGEVCVYGCM